MIETPSSTADRRAHTLEETQRTMRVAGRRSVADAIDEFVLEPIDGAGPLPASAPGSHIDVAIADGQWRQYSLVSPVTEQWRIAVLDQPGGRGGSRYLHEHVRVGDEIAVRGPRNHFELRRGQRYLFLAGGIGITPLLSMAVHCDGEGRQWELVYCARNEDAMAYLDELTALRGELRLNRDDVDGILDLAGLLRGVDAGTLVYACGPAPFLNAVETAMADSPAEALVMERFNPVEIDDGDDREFEVDLAVSDMRLTVPAGKSVLEVVSEAGVPVLSSCAEGTCGTCETPVLEGDVDHRDSILSAEEKEQNEVMMICVSRARCPRLTLEL